MKITTRHHSGRSLVIQCTYAIAAFGLLSATAASSQADELCTAAVQHVSGCTEYCGVPGSSPTCAADLAEIQQYFSVEPCPAEATSVTNRSCANLVGSGFRSGNACLEAASHMLDCLRTPCASAPDNPMCANLEMIMDEMGEMECTDLDEEGAEEILAQSCSEINAMLGF